jgi:hypothetical protein
MQRKPNKTKSTEHADLLREKLNAAEEVAKLRAIIVALMTPDMLQLAREQGVDPVVWAENYVKLVEKGWMKAFDK